VKNSPSSKCISFQITGTGLIILPVQMSSSVMSRWHSWEKNGRKDKSQPKSGMKFWLV